MLRAILANTKSEDMVVTDISSLQQLFAEPRLLLRHGRVLLHLKGLTPPETEYWQCRLNKYYSACGCTSGTIVMAFAVELYVFLLAYGLGDLSRLSWLHLALGGLVGLLGALFGKLLGLGWARYQFKKLVLQLALHLQIAGID